jgi:hypothetical protein
MNKVTLDEIAGVERYEQIRDQFRRRIIDLKKHRRVPVGDRVTFVFENHETMLFQIQEMMRAEHIVDLDRIREEIAVYNALIPDQGELSATMLIEITEEERIRDELLRFLGVEETVRLEIGEPTRACAVVGGQFETGHSREDKLSAVQYVRFALYDSAREAFVGGAEPVRLVIDHPNYRYTTTVEGAVRQSLARDLGDA